MPNYRKIKYTPYIGATMHCAAFRQAFSAARSSLARVALLERSQAAHSVTDALPAINKTRQAHATFVQSSAREAQAHGESQLLCRRSIGARRSSVSRVSRTSTPFARIPGMRNTVNNKIPVYVGQRGMKRKLSQYLDFQLHLFRVGDLNEG